MVWANVRRFQLFTASLYAAAASANVFVLQMNDESLTEVGAQAYHFVVGVPLIARLMSDPLIPSAKRPSLDSGMFAPEITCPRAFSANSNS